MIQRLKNIYINAIVPKMITQFGYQNKLQVPKINKVIINDAYSMYHIDKQLKV